MLRRACALALGLACTIATVPAGAQPRTRLTVYTALENEQLAPLKAAAEGGRRPPSRSPGCATATGVITARLTGREGQPARRHGLGPFGLLPAADGGAGDAGALHAEGRRRPAGRRCAAPSPMTWAGMDAFVSAICFNTVVAKEKRPAAPDHLGRPAEPRLQGPDRHAEPGIVGHRLPDVAGWIGTKGEARLGLHGEAA